MWLRVAAASLALAALGLTVALALWTGRKLQRPGHILATILGRNHLELSGRATRAFGLWERLEADPAPKESPSLARLHLSRILDEIQPAAAKSAGRRVRSRRQLGALLLGVTLITALVMVPLSLLEGIDVLFARRGVGPFPLNYIERLAVTARWPSYLDGTKKSRYMSSRLTAVPQGSEVEVRVIPLRADRALLLTDGVREVPFLSDGQGGLLARWIAEDPSELRVAVRFGEVLLYDGSSTRLAPIDDRSPEVLLEGAPREMQLEDVERLPLQFYAHDDHGLSQIDLVVESGQRSERSELAHLDGQRPLYRGGHTLTRDHELLKKAFLPVRVRIEARDGNSATGPSWGRSQEIVLTPKPLGKDVAERHRAFRKLRTALSHFYADHSRATGLSGDAAGHARAAAHEKLLGELAELETLLLETGEVPQSSAAFIRAQVEALGRVGPERALPQAVLLAIDALIQRIGHSEAQQLAEDLGSAVEELAVQTRELRFHEEGVKKQGLLDLFAGVSLGAEQLREVGTLGLDLGSVARADLARIARKLEAKEYERAEGAAVHLAERLKRGTASFSSSGGGGVESGTPSPGQGQGTPGSEGQGASDAPAQFQDLAHKLDQLAQDNAKELSELERLMQEAARAAAADFKPDEQSEQAAQELREAMSRLPSTGFGPGSPRSEASVGRAEGEAMADAMDGHDFTEALERGRNAEAALQRAARLAEQHPGWLDNESLADAQRAVREALSRAQQAEQALRRKAKEEQSDRLAERSAARQKLAERARQLAREGRDPSAPLPEQNLKALEQAAQLLQQSEQALRAGELESGREYSEQAQVKLEEALPQSEDGAQGDESAESTSSAANETTHGSVPDEERDRAKDFRERVERGLAREGGRLTKAVRRYAEELK